MVSLATDATKNSAGNRGGMILAHLTMSSFYASARVVGADVRVVLCNLLKGMVSIAAARLPG